MSHALDDKRLGLLVRMFAFKAMVASKKVITPLLNRGYVKRTETGSYCITRSGKKFVEGVWAGGEERALKTYGILSIGGIVGIVMEDRPKKLAAEHQKERVEGE